MQKDPKVMLEACRTLYFEAQRTGLMEKIDRHDLTFLQRNILIFISRLKGVGMTELSRMLSLKGPALTRITDVLEKKGLVKRTSLPGDRRTYVLVLTPDGKKITSKLEEVPVKTIKKLMEVTSEEDYRSITRGVKLLNDKLGRII